MANQRIKLSRPLDWDALMWSLLVALSIATAGLVLEGPAFAQMNVKEVLILDFTGHWDKGSKHAQTFQETVLPDANAVYSTRSLAPAL
jgi:hypothetical protein